MKWTFERKSEPQWKRIELHEPEGDVVAHEVIYIDDDPKKGGAIRGLNSDGVTVFHGQLAPETND